MSIAYSFGNTKRGKYQSSKMSFLSKFFLEVFSGRRDSPGPGNYEEIDRGLKVTKDRNPEWE